jgi:hypothetical protein
MEGELRKAQEGDSLRFFLTNSYLILYEGECVRKNEVSAGA